MIEIHCGDYRDWLKAIEPGSVDLMFNDPPFGTGFDYGDGQFKDDMGREEYLRFSKAWIIHSWTLLKPTGALWIAIGDEYAAELKCIATDGWFTLRNWCVQHYAFGPHLTKKFGRNKVHLLYLVKDAKKFAFNADDIRVPSLRQTKYNDKRADSKGRVPGDVWEMARLPGNAKERTSHPCQMSEKVLDRIIRATSNPGELVVDFFGGSFVSAAVSMKLGRNCISGDISPEFCEMGRKRLAAIRSPVAEVSQPDIVQPAAIVAAHEVRNLNA